MALKIQVGFRQRGQRKCDARSGQTHLLMTKRMLRGQYLDIGKHVRLATKQMSQRAFVDQQIQSCPPIPKNGNEHVPKRLGAGGLDIPTSVYYSKLDAVLAREGCIDEFVLHTFCSYID